MNGYEWVLRFRRIGQKKWIDAASCNNGALLLDIAGDIDRSLRYEMPAGDYEITMVRRRKSDGKIFDDAHLHN